MRFVLALIAALVFGSTAFAVQPDEVLKDPVLEKRAREISAGLRCPVCRNESIDESNADLARDIRTLVRERLRAGDTDAEVRAVVVDRYGEFILLRPTLDGANLVLWLAAPALAVAGLGLGYAAIRRRSLSTADPLTEDEEAELRTILRR